MRVNSLRNNRGIVVFARERDGARTVAIETAAQILGVNTTAVRRLIERSVLRARHPVPYARSAVSHEQLESEKVKAPLWRSARAASRASAKRSGRTPKH
jgi:hypothetical protein